MFSLFNSESRVITGDQQENMPRFEKCRIQARRACLRLSTPTKHARAKGCPFETLWGYALVTDGLRASVLALSCGSMEKASQAVLLAGLICRVS